MALVEIPGAVNRIRFPDINLARFSSRSRGNMSREREIVEELEPRTAPSPAHREETMYVALGKDVKGSEATLIWALHNSRGMKICVLHIHQPAQKIPLLGTKVAISRLEENQVNAYHENERQEMLKIIDKYIQICEQSGVKAEKLCKELDSIEKGIVQLIHERDIKWLVMGAAADKSYSRKMKEPKSKKAIHVRLEAPTFCQIWFICKGNRIYTRESKLDGVNIEEYSPPVQASPNSEVVQTWRSRSLAEGERGRMELQRSAISHRRFTSENNGMHFSSPGRGSPCSSLNQEGNSDRDNQTRRTPSVGSRFSSGSSGEIIDNSAADHVSSSQNYHSSSVASRDSSMDDEFYTRLEQFAVEAQNSRKEAYEESVKRKKAEKEAIDAFRRAKESNAMLAEEQRHRREIEELLASAREEAENMKWQLGKVTEALRVAEEQKLFLERQITDSDKMVETLEQKMYAAVELLQKYKKERDELQVQRDDILKVAEDLRKRQTEEASSSSVSQFFSEFSFFEIEEATARFSQTLKIGEGGYGSIYRGNLRHTQVAIKMLHPDSSQGPLEFQQEVNILSTLRHPNIITLVGACPEAWALVYEYQSHGSLEDRLACKNNTPPLSWKTRIRIAAELCSALIFLHSFHPEGIVHGDLKPANVLLDANFVSKLSDFGICRNLPHDELSVHSTRCWKTDPKGTLGYMDPEFLTTGELTSKSDVYSFGIILLRLLTGRPALGITREVRYALDNGKLKDLLDPTAGDWPFVQAKQLAHLALSCAYNNRGRRPDLASEVWRVLEPMKRFCGASLRFGSEEQSHIPAYFICPIFQEIMQDPVVAADGYTYESEALKGWLENGHDTSPMTDLKLPHSDMVPNHTLRSAIQDWLHRR
ncbi:U-box domain-containing protein 33-like [Salvia hispanica]|uniref:U-box domain-containing protein 33-like n=1 Tax=Salvia hispanica TaxID=49212 RepID=UPI0020090767|nr:U-box domain-containing protein 33-like [Salvia hispanica]